MESDDIEGYWTRFQSNISDFLWTVGASLTAASLTIFLTLISVIPDALDKPAFLETVITMSYKVNGALGFSGLGFFFAACHKIFKAKPTPIVVLAISAGCSFAAAIFLAKVVSHYIEFINETAKSLATIG